MKQLLVIFTGGTIGSQSSDGTINVKDAGAYRLIEGYLNDPASLKDIRLDAIQPLNLLSENLTPNDWLTLAAAIREVDYSAYAGIIVTHGSDTLAYSAAMLSYLFADISIPLVLTASNYPLDDPRSNGNRNFQNAIHFIADAELPGVFVVYENDASQSLVYLGTRITQAISFTDQYGSPYGVPYGQIDNGRFARLEHERNPLPESLRASTDSTFQWTPDSLCISDEVVYIKPYPGLNYSMYSFAGQGSKPRAILHDLHHSGTACAVDEGPYSLPQFIKRCRAEGIPTYICPIRDGSAALYSSTRKLIDAGAIMIESISADAALMKLMLGLGAFSDERDVEAFVTKQQLYYEFNERTER